MWGENKPKVGAAGLFTHAHTQNISGRTHTKLVITAAFQEGTLGKWGTHLSLCALKKRWLYYQFK